jgi:hypothetical protein
MEAEMADKTYTIKIPKGGRLEGKVPLGVNGRIVTVNTDQNFKAGEHILEALNNASIEYVVISDDGSEMAPADAGVASAGVHEVVGTASRDEAALDEGGGTADGNHNDLINPTFLGGDGQGDAARISGLETADGTVAGTADSTAEGGVESKEPGPLDQSVADLTTHLETVTDAAEIDKLIAAEKGGKSRVTALDALEARKAALTTPAE